MGEIKGQGKKSLIIKTWERCKSIGRGGNNNNSNNNNSSPFRRTLTKKSKSWPRSLSLPEESTEQRGRKRRVAPEGCFSVYVGPEKQRFVIKTGYANHPLFIMLLEEAEMEYGYNSDGPLTLPCDVDIFIKVLLEMDDGDDDHGDRMVNQRCGFASRGYASYHPLCPSPLIAMNQF